MPEAFFSPPMVSPALSSDFPPLSSSPHGSPIPLSNRNWSSMFDQPVSSSDNISLSFYPEEPATVAFSGEFQLLSLSDGFFLLRFSSMEDFDLGISRIASKVGIPLAVDPLTAKKTRLTYARVCIQVTCEAKYPDEIPISLDGDEFCLKVQYEWHPTPCDLRKSITHAPSSCPSKLPVSSDHAETLQPGRGRSTSRKPTRLHQSKPNSSNPQTHNQAITHSPQHQETSAPNDNPTGNHTPILGIPNSSKHRFLFKNYWTKLDRFWIDVLDTFSATPMGNPMVDLCCKLKDLKAKIKTRDWSNSSALHMHLNLLHSKQAECLDRINSDPLNTNLNLTLKDINYAIVDSTSMLTSWVSQRAKTKWIRQGEDDLKFLYAKICARQAGNKAVFNMGWNLPSNIHNNFTSKISELPIFPETHKTLTWNNCPVTAFGQYISHFYIDLVNCSWYDCIWHKNYAIRYASFAWSCIIGGLKTAAALSHRNIYVDPTCSLCNGSVESSSHLFFECDFSFSILVKIIPDAAVLLFRPSILQLLDWINEHDCSMKDLRLLSACCSMYHIWKERNGRRFGNSVNSQSTVISHIKKAVYAKIYKWRNFEYLKDKI
ncbi:hypothetical protein M5K25_024490 [Dendrobium thyrsiflorum]|uniref:Reverse transcriptase zinc-binding domain-containing protein n=1 Tax=Dendrobium thyrsiflorum TaxID=117978 RepID=A0ABD0U222_DENTH